LCSIVSLTLIGNSHRSIGLIIHFLTPAVAQTIRLAGDDVMTVGAWRRSGRLITAGTLIVMAGWSRGLVAQQRASRAEL